MEDAAKTYLARMAEAVASVGSVHTALLLGSAGDQILDYLNERPAGLVVMSSHARAGFARAALGSVVDRLLHGPAPVLVLRPEDEIKSRMVEAAIAGTA